MTFLMIYLMGALVGFGLSYTLYDFAIRTNNEEDMPFDRTNYLIFGAIFSWFTVVMFLLGVVSGLLKSDDEDGG